MSLAVFLFALDQGFSFLLSPFHKSQFITKKNLHNLSAEVGPHPFQNSKKKKNRQGLNREPGSQAKTKSFLETRFLTKVIGPLPDLVSGKVSPQKMSSPPVSPMYSKEDLKKGFEISGLATLESGGDGKDGWEQKLTATY